MTVQAAGSYLRVLREARGISRDAIAEAAATSVSQILRIERGQQETRSSVLLMFVQMVGGSTEELAALLLDAKADADIGEQRARAWAVLTTPTPSSDASRGRVATLIQLVNDMRTDVSSLDKLIGYGTRLLDEQREQQAVSGN
jgi:transcriptional regulator with XRE-family HTH domain